MRSTLFAAPAAIVAGLAIACAAAPALAQDTGPAKVGQTSAGPTLTTAEGMTLYTYNRDMVGYSNCNGPCATAWPPLAATADAKAGGAWSVIVRDDGKHQWAYNGKALYTFAKDAKAGDATGDGADNGKWRVAKP